MSTLDRASARIISQAAGSTKSASQRLISLDAFRGLTMLFMVLANNGGGPVSYAPLEHSEWNGWTMTDTVFPSFVWIIGVAITLGAAQQVRSR